MKQSKIIGGVLIGLMLLSGYLAADWYSSFPAEVSKSYIGRTSCVACHVDQCAKFDQSHHDKAMDQATDQSVLGNFNDATLEHFGITSRMYRDGQKFMIQTEGPNGEMQDFEIKYVFGVSPLQQYMVEISRPSDARENEIGQVQVLRVSWDTHNKRWFYLSPPDVQEKLSPDDPLHWTGITQNWNTSCAECHSTNLQKNFQLLTGEYRTTFSEIDVSCEACHGPASLHVELANQTSFFWDRTHGMGLVNLKTRSNVTQVESCAPCHSRRSIVKTGFQPGCNFDEYYSLQLLTAPAYHTDGQIRDEDYVYGSFLQSKMYHAGIKCSDCHDPHSATLIHSGNSICTSCHQHAAGKYDSPAHHHHAPGTAGAACVNCHMPATTYMALDQRRDHSFRVPRPDLSLTTNSPNACSGCHLKSAESDLDLDATTQAGPGSISSSAPHASPNHYLELIGAAERGDQEATQRLRKLDSAMVAATKQWYPADLSPPKTQYYEQFNLSQTAIIKHGTPIPPVESDIGAAPSIATNIESAEKQLVKLAGDARTPDIFRASAIDVLCNTDGVATHVSLESAFKLLNSPSIKIASSAIRRLEVEINRLLTEAQSTPSSSRARVLSQLAPVTRALGTRLAESKSFRLRAEAARALSMIPTAFLEQTLPPAQRTAYRKGIKEYQRSLAVSDDRASVHLVLGSLHERLGQPNTAIDDYRNAISVEPTLVGPRSNLAALLEQNSNGIDQQILQMTGAQQTDRRLLSTLSGQSQTLQRQAQKLRSEEHALLKRDVKRSAGLPNTDWLNYRLGMSCYLHGELEEAENQLRIAYEKSPQNVNYQLGLATFYLQMKKPDQARPLVEALLRSAPNNRTYQLMMQQLKSQE